MRKKQDQQRRSKLREVLSLISERPKFRRQEIQFLCREASPAFVTKVLKQLHAEGVLQQNNSQGQVSYEWNDQTFHAEQWIDRQIVGDQVTQLPAEERPRERLLAVGAAQLKNSELLAVLIRSGRPGESAMQAGQRLAQKFVERIGELPRCSMQELRDISQSVSVAAYCQIMAGIELGRRVAQALDQRAERPKIISTQAAIEYCRNHFQRLATDALQEEFHIVTLDTKLQPIRSHRITVGTLDASLVHPREVFKAAVRDSASSILLVHNHPSGDPTPSRHDREITQRLRQVGEVMGIQVVDHIIVARDRTVSLAEC
ncbi:MAG: DNA repair protein RadC [Pirellulaceae bacterium]|nr:DNA repair protein RadC [Pirellulaceae bacterium]